uniref:Membrane protein a150 n=1 Tax=Mastomys natalensis cytomegalovirus 2 TaxID=2973540 RepID=A0A9Y1IMK6_9BETA|nr:membrane protein a150 [Mastomys natalensis cytomegalovirus 2]WEG69276.1 membrane protein a150 [Mastomys natalensis cytomegalovirus 2]WEG69415.1 membrane protein a150 [Mastomys natalensis cytomegalovirus 2]WEG69553.1 membrane protein a150 [Mastomys natalensis cytomegalovirus 2]WEG69691.1 membrane protein a150 [Mastomys natalensis cytomegalovirus 2]
MLRFLCVTVILSHTTRNIDRVTATPTHHGIIVAFSWMNSRSGAEIGTISVNNSFPIVTVKGNGALREHGNFIRNPLRSDPDIVFLTSQRKYLASLRSVLARNLTSLRVRYECLFVPRLRECTITHAGDNMDAFSGVVRFVNGTKYVAATLQNVEPMSVEVTTEIDMLEKDAGFVYERWLYVQYKILKLSYPENIDAVFRVSLGKVRYVHCTMWSPAPIPFSITLTGKGLHSIKGTAFHSVSQAVAMVSSVVPPGSILSELVCSISSPTGWSFILRDPLRKGIRKIPDDATHTHSEHNELSIVSAITAFAALTVLNSVICAAVVFKRRDDNTLSATARETLMQRYSSHISMSSSRTSTMLEPMV